MFSLLLWCCFSLIGCLGCVLSQVVLLWLYVWCLVEVWLDFVVCFVVVWVWTWWWGLVDGCILCLWWFVLLIFFGFWLWLFCLYCWHDAFMWLIDFLVGCLMIACLFWFCCNWSLLFTVFGVSLLFAGLFGSNVCWMWFRPVMIGFVCLCLICLTLCVYLVIEFLLDYCLVLLLVGYWCRCCCLLIWIALYVFAFRFGLDLRVARCFGCCCVADHRIGKCWFLVLEAALRGCGFGVCYTVGLRVYLYVVAVVDVAFCTTCFTVVNLIGVWLVWVLYVNVFVYVFDFVCFMCVGVWELFAFCADSCCFVCAYVVVMMYDCSCLLIWLLVFWYFIWWFPSRFVYVGLWCVFKVCSFVLHFDWLYLVRWMLFVWT